MMTAKELLKQYLEHKGVQRGDWDSFEWIDRSDDEHIFESANGTYWCEWCCGDLYRLWIDDTDDANILRIIEYFANQHNWMTISR